jgi:hypothetical protein
MGSPVCIWSEGTYDHMEMSSAERVHLFAQVLPYEHDTQYYRLAYLQAWIYSWPGK